MFQFPGNIIQFPVHLNAYYRDSHVPLKSPRIHGCWGQEMKEHRHQASSQLPSNIHRYRPTSNEKPWLYHLGIRQRIYLYFIFANEDGDILIILEYNDENGAQFNNTQRTSK